MPSPLRRFARPVALGALCALAAAGCGEVKVEKRQPTPRSAEESAAAARERRLEGARPLTSEGVNRQASFSADGRAIVWLQRPLAGGDFALHAMQADGSEPHLVDTGPGRRHDPSFAPDGTALLYAAAPAGAPPVAPETGGSGAGGLWLFDPALDLTRCAPDGSGRVVLGAAPGYDAEGSWSWGGAKIVFTSFRDGRGGLWLMNADGAAATKLVDLPYAGGARISPDGSLVAFHAAAAGGGQELEIYVADLAGGNPRALTNLGATSLSPAWHPTQQWIVFSSNSAEHDFELWLVRPDGTGLERVTHSRGFDGFPCFSRDGQQLLWTSQRGAAAAGQTHIWRAAWQG